MDIFHLIGTLSMLEGIELRNPKAMVDTGTVVVSCQRLYIVQCMGRRGVIVVIGHTKSEMSNVSERVCDRVYDYTDILIWLPL